MTKKTGHFFLALLGAAAILFSQSSLEARPSKRQGLSAKSAIIMDAATGNILYSKNPRLKLPPASTVKVMTAMIALERLPLNQKVLVSQRACDMAPSKAGLTPGATYSAGDLITAALVSSSNDAAFALGEAISGDEKNFSILMNEKAARLGMRDTKFVNATGLPDKFAKQYSTALDMASLMRTASRDSRIDQIMGITTAVIRGSDGKVIPLRSHNKMLWRTPGFVKGKTGWTFASRHTFIGTNFSPNKTITFAMLSSKDPWTDIARLAQMGLWLKARH